MSRLTRFSLANRTVVLLLAVLIIITGLASARALKQETIPSTDWPASTIISIYPGASPSSVEQEVSKPIEDAALAVDGVKTVTSISSSNTSQVTVEWEWGEDTDQIMADIRAAVDSADIPDIVDPTVSSGSFDDLPILTVAVTSNLTAGELSNQAEDVMVPAIKDVEGVQDVTIAGDEKREIDITFDVEKTNELGVDPTSIGQLFGANSKAYPSGTLRTDSAEIDVQTGRTYESVEQVEDLEVQGEDGRVRLGDIATVEELPTVSTSVSRVNGKDAVTLAVTKESAANTIAVSHDVKAELDKLEKQLGNGTNFEAVFDQAPFIEQSIHDLSLEGGIGLLMAVLIILLFLRSLAPTFISGVSIPLSLLFAMTGLFVGGYTLNIFTLGALTVAIGRVVDDSIVVIENIKRHQGLGETGMGTLVRSVKEVAGAVTSSTLTTVAVFAPIGMVGGQAGSFFRPFALTVVISLLASLVVSLTVVPVLASYIMQRRASTAEIRAQAHDEADGWLQHAYLPVLNWALAHRLITVVLAILIFVGTMAMAPYLKTDFIGAGSATNLQVVQTMPTGTSIKETSAAARRVEDVIRRQPNLDTYSTEIGGGGSVFIAVKNDSNKASINVLIEPGTDPILAAKRLRADLAKLDGIGRIEVAVGDSETSGKVVVYVESPNSARLAAASGKVEAMMEDVEGLTNVSSDIGEQRQMLDVDVDEIRAAELGMNQATVGQAVAWAVRGEKIGEMTKDDTTLDVYLRSQEPATELSELRDLVLPVTQRMTMDAREDAGDAVEARGDALKDEQEDDAEDDFEKSIRDMKEQREDSEEASDELLEQINAARVQLADLEAQRNADPNSPNVTRLDKAIEDLQARIAQLSQARSGSKEGADGIDDQIEEMREKWDESQEMQDKADAIDDAADGIEDLRARPATLRDVADVAMVEAASQITRVDGARAVTITASSEGADLSAITAGIKTGLAELDLGEGVTARLGGVSEQQEQSFGQLGAAMLVAIGIVYLIMVATFRSLIQPLILLVSIPFAATGALGLSLLTDSAIGIPSMIGMLMLIGIVVTNAIVLIDMINQRRNDGVSVEDSIMAGARLRVRPIIMTALATICALLPMGLGVTGGGIFISRPLAIVVIGGLISSSILTLILVPVLYDLVEHRPDWLRFGKKQRAQVEEFTAESNREREATQS
jgi:HAE1 family hydrophobic/amphiphilic exporter-1